ncbi:MAG: hypothetical protein JJ896_11745 [Rhodothermales bacterium]|nr:hypothetical protein [Rhodothermales bacterium]MBO6780317.1 hypothetical protein [Rhodothermales bacterium]
MIKQFYARSKPLTVGGLIFVVGFVVAVVLSFFDDRIITGLNAWYKPIKFAASLAIYMLTLAWLVTHLREFAPRSIKAIEWVIALVMTAEGAAIFLQAARGVPSHFNFSTPLDGSIFGIMGLLIIVNTVTAAWLTILYFRYSPPLPTAYLWGIRLGLVVFLFFSMEGYLMIQRMAHAVGAPDDAAGLPILGWSRVGGDLRWAHFIGMHALQLLPLTGWFLNRRADRLPFRPVLGVVVVALLHTALAVWATLHALAGKPVIPLP